MTSECLQLLRQEPSEVNRVGNGGLYILAKNLEQTRKAFCCHIYRVGIWCNTNIPIEIIVDKICTHMLMFNI
jgi:hypothetical protein